MHVTLSNNTLSKKYPYILYFTMRLEKKPGNTKGLFSERQFLRFID